MKRFSILFSLLLVSMIFYNCQREVSFNAGNVNNNEPNPITAILQGNITDENGQPAEGVNVKVGGQSATTDNHGYFRIRNAALDKYSSLVTAEKDGYFKAFRSFCATSGTNQVEIKLIKKESAGTIDAAAGGDVTLSNGMKVALPANGVVIAAGGGAYSGAITVYAHYIDPTASDIARTVPGSFMANDKNDKRVVLTSYGMMAVELQSAAGQKLQIKEGAKATLTCPIPSAMQSSAPASIALWYVDEQTGIWQEEGTATKSGNQYIGEVKHFSFWNCDISFNSINLSMTVKNANNIPLVHVYVKIKRPSTNMETYGITDSLGQVSGMVPSNEGLVLEVLDQCYNAVYTQNIGPFNQNTNIGDVVLSGSLTANSVVTIKGRVVNCSGVASTNGYVIISYNNGVRYASVDANGNFTSSYIICGSSPTTCGILPVDETTQQQGNLATVNINLPITDAGDLSGCGTTYGEYINFTLDGTAYNIATPDSLIGYSQAGTTSGVTSLMGDNMNAQTHFSLNFNSTATTGTYPATSLSIQTNNNNYSNANLIQPFNVIVTSFPITIGQFYEGSFSGQFTDASNVTHTITNGSFRLRKNW